MTDTYRLLANEIVVVLLKDYERAPHEAREEMRAWAKESPLLRFCADVSSIEEAALREGILVKMIAVDEREVRALVARILWLALGTSDYEGIEPTGD